VQQVTRIVMAMAAVLAVATGFLSYQLYHEQELASSAAIMSQPGMALIAEYRCRRAETKHIFLRGEEDAFSPAGNEPISISARSQSQTTLSRSAGAKYDHSQPDYFFYDHFVLPPQISSGLLVISLLSISSNDNDEVIIGDVTASAGSIALSDREVFVSLITGLEHLDGWHRTGDLYHARLADIRFGHHVENSDDPTLNFELGGAFPNLLEYIRAATDEQIVDVMISDDTSVDFMSMVVCEEPLDSSGMTFGVVPMLAAEVNGEPAELVSCYDENGPDCDPFVGDTPCGTPLPLLCFNDLDLPAPASGRDIHWSGGRIAATRAVPGNQFVTIADADALCATEFGRGWRTATYHDGGRGAYLVGYGQISERSSRMWVDIQNQPYATCWARQD
jgi:hypothetical protein